MQAMDRMINSISTEIIDSKVDGQDKASTMESGLRDIDGRVRSIEQMVKKIRSEVEGRDYKETLAKIHGSLKETNTNLLNDLPASISQGKNVESPKNFANLPSCYQIISSNGLLSVHHFGVSIKHGLDLRFLQEAAEL